MSILTKFKRKPGRITFPLNFFAPLNFAHFQIFRTISIHYGILFLK